jgi:site-specific DNA-methyltransferase (adenine-specific)/adenine-specific DNA-methyltransferase
MPTLHWIGKEAVVNHHHQVPFHLLQEDPTLSCGAPGSGNLIVEGDNLLALKALLPYYAGQVKCIYIDPPYNTGNEGWVYNDNVNSPLMRQWLGKVVGKEGETLDRHDRWLCMMYPRLALLRQFLREDGAIFISIDDNEVHLLRILLDNVFGPDNFIASFVWQKRISPDNDETFATAVHDYIMCYAKHKDRCIFNRLPRTDEADARYENPDNDPRGVWTSSDLTRREYREHDYYAIKLPSGREVFPSAGRSWSIPKANFDSLVSDNRIWFGPTGNSMPRRKRFLSEVSQGLVPTTWWTKDLYGDNQAAKKELRVIFPEISDIFATPKPEQLITQILQIASSPGDLVLDSFSGSGTTGHSVLKLNHNHPNQPGRRFILVEMEPTIARNITSKRVRRVAEGYTDAKGEAVAGLGGGFRYCRLGEPLFDESGKIRPTVSFAELARHVYFSETGEPLPHADPLTSPLLGVCRGVAIYLLYNGILGDQREEGGNLLTRTILAQLPPFAGPKVIYCAGALLGRERLQAEQVVVRQIPYEIKIA